MTEEEAKEVASRMTVFITGETEEDGAKRRAIAASIAAALDQHSATSGEALHAVAFMMGSAITAVAEDVGCSSEQITTIADILIRSAITIHKIADTDGMTAN